MKISKMVLANLLQRSYDRIRRIAPSPSPVASTPTPPSPSTKFSPKFTLVDGETFPCGKIHVKVVGHWKDVNGVKEVDFQARLPSAFIHKSVDKLTTVMSKTLKSYVVSPECVSEYNFNRIGNAYMIGATIYFRATYVK